MMKNTSNKILVMLTVIASVVVSSCSHMKTVALYSDSQLNNAQVSNVGGFYSTDIFTDDVTDMWGIEKTSDGCKTFGQSLYAYNDGGISLDLAWDKSKCEWIGLGFGWNAWQSKNMSGVVEGGALQFYAKAKEAPFKLNLLFRMEDFSGKPSFCKLKPTHFENGDNTVDTTWTRVSVPFSDFNIKRSRIDMGDIKQLILQFEGRGDMYFDQFTVAPIQKIAMKEEK